MKILVTGGKGYIGSYLVPFLEKKGHTVITWDIEEDEDIFDEIFEDILESADIVIHLAALTSVSESFNKTAEYFRTNIAGTIHVASLCAKHHKKIIYMSSSAVYEPDSSPYALSKTLSEQVIQELGEINRYVIFRLFNVYSLIPKKGTVMDRFLSEGNLLMVNGDGGQVRDFIRIEDVCSIVLDSFYNRYNNLTIDVGMGRGTNILDLAKYFEKYHNKGIVYTNKAREVKWSVANTRLLKKVYKRKYITNLEKDIKHMEVLT